MLNTMRMRQQNEIFCWKRSKQKENVKNETSTNKHIFDEKGEMDTRQGDTQKGKIEKNE